MSRRPTYEIPEIVPAAATVALVGRTNVGKSSLFNRLTEHQTALVSAEPHVTRDRHEGQVSWEHYTFNLFDTGGYDIPKNDPFAEDVRKQAEGAVAASDLVLFVIDQREVLPDDRSIAQWLRTMHVPVFLVVNKVERRHAATLSVDAAKLGFADVWFVSAKTGGGTGDLLDAVVSKLKSMRIKRVPKAPPVNPLSIAFVGQPNVGKSSLINALLGDERVIVSAVPHTTRASQVIYFEAGGKPYQLIDTAGLRKRANRLRAANKKRASQIEVESADQTESIIELADVIILVVDATQPLFGQDSRIARLIVDAGKSLIIVANKWDLLPQKSASLPDKVRKNIYAYYPYLRWAPIVVVSAATRKNIFDILATAQEIALERAKEIPEKALDNFLKKLVKKHKPSRGKGTAHPRLLSLTQMRTNPPTFELLTEYLNLHPAYLRFLDKEMRAAFGFKGTPIKIQMRPLKN